MPKIISRILASMAVMLLSTSAFAQEPTPDGVLTNVLRFGEAQAAGDEQKVVTLASELAVADLSAAGFTAEEIRQIRTSLASTLLSAGEHDQALVLLQLNLADLDQLIEQTENDLRQSELRRSRIDILRILAEAYSELEDLEAASNAIEKALLEAEDLFGVASPELRFVLAEKIDIDHASQNEREADKMRLSGLEERAAEQSLMSLGNEDGSGCAANSECVRVFYASSRQATGKSEPSRAFNGRRGDLSYGSALVSVPKERVPGALPRGGLLSFGSEEGVHFIVKRIDSYTNAPDFAERLSRSLDAVADAPREAFVYVHGFNTSFEDATMRTAQLAVDLDMRQGGVLYAWPSGEGLFGYQEGQNNVDFAVEGLVELLKVTAPEAGNLHLVAHSMGNRVLMEALDRLEEDGFTVEGRDGAPFAQLVWASPDVDAVRFSKQASSLTAMVEGMTLYASRHDRALQLSKRLGGSYSRAGQTPPIQSVAEVTTFVDTSDLKRGFGDFVAHSDFADSAIEDLRAVLWFSLAPEARCPLVLKTPNEGAASSYWSSSPNEGCGETEFRRAISAWRFYGDDAPDRIEDLLKTLRADGSRPDDVRSWTEAKAILTALR